MPHDPGAVPDPVGAQLRAEPRGVLRQVQREGEPAGQLREEQVPVQGGDRVQEVCSRVGWV